MKKVSVGSWALLVFYSICMALMAIGGLFCGGNALLGLVAKWSHGHAVGAEDLIGLGICALVAAVSSYSLYGAWTGGWNHDATEGPDPTFFV